MADNIDMEIVRDSISLCVSESKNLINSIQSSFIAVVILLQLRNALSNCVTTETPRALGSPSWCRIRNAIML